MKSFRSGRLALFIVLGLLAGSGCGSKEEAGAINEKATLTQGSAIGSAGGVYWSVPPGWKDAGERPMRVATYSVPPADGGAAGECAVFYFGSGEGGDTRANIDRWLGQFENPSAPLEATREVNGMQVTTVTTTGTFLAPSGPMMESQGKKENYMLMGAIVDGPQGSIFFKLTGPSATVTAAKGDFDAVLESIQPSK